MCYAVMKYVEYFKKPRLSYCGQLWDTPTRVSRH